MARLFSSFFRKLKTRDPNDRLVRSQASAVNIMKRYHAMFLGMLIVAGHMTYRQIKNPGMVKLCRQDGRSMVT